MGLHALQHRGQEAAGIVSFDGVHFHSHRAVGLIGDTFSRRSVIDGLPGHAAIGHARYSTTGASMLRNVQPLFADFAFGGLAVGHNGNLTNAMQLRRRLVERGLAVPVDQRHRGDHPPDRPQPAPEHRRPGGRRAARGRGRLVAGRPVRRRHHRRARSPGRAAAGAGPSSTGRWILASETCALDILGADFVRDIEPGEVVVIDADGVRSLRPFAPEPRRFCIFEYVYFSRPDSVVEGMGVYEVRKQIGAELARESGVAADVVVPVPDSGVPAAIGYAQESGIGFELGIIRNHYIGRTFIEPTDHIRNLGVKLKHNANRVTLAGKRVVLVDDSIVRGTTSTKIVGMVRAAGATEVHMRIASPPTTHSCYYGVDTPERSQLMAATILARGDGADHRRRQPGIPVHRRAVPRGRRGAPQRGAAAILRRLLHRGISRPA